MMELLIMVEFNIGGEINRNEHHKYDFKDIKQVING